MLVKMQTTMNMGKILANPMRLKTFPTTWRQTTKATTNELEMKDAGMTVRKNSHVVRATTSQQPGLKVADSSVEPSLFSAWRGISKEGEPMWVVSAAISLSGQLIKPRRARARSLAPG